MHYFEKCRAEIYEVEVALSTRIDTEMARLDSEVGVLKRSSASQQSKNTELSENLDKVMGKMEEYKVAVEQKIDEKTSNIAQMSISEVLERRGRINSSYSTSKRVTRLRPRTGKLKIQTR